MSSTYSSKYNSLSAEKEIFCLPSRAVSYTPAKAPQQQQPHSFRTVPDSPKHCRLISLEHGLDIAILTHKLQLYQLELEEAQLRFERRRRMQDTKEALEVAAAARFREEIEKRDKKLPPSPKQQKKESPPLPSRELGARIRHSRSVSLQDTSAAVFGTTTHKLPERSNSKLNRRRPVPLQLNGVTDVPAQEVQSAALPTRRKTILETEEKRHRRMTTIAPDAKAGSKIILVSSPGEREEHDFTADIPPVPQLSASASTIASPPNSSPMTPQLTEDQIRRELETYALEEGPNIERRRVGLATNRPRPYGTYFPDVDDRTLPEPPNSPKTPTIVVSPEPQKEAESKVDNHAPSLSRKKSFFSRFERKNEVDSLLDLYMTEEQLTEEKTHKKSIKSKRQTLFKRWASTEHLGPRAELPG